MRPFPVASLCILTLWAVGLGGCYSPFEVECGADAHCNRFPGGLCHANLQTDRHWCKYPDPACPSGYRYSDLDVGDGVSATCVPADVDEGPIVPVTPIVENGQRADLVLGQEIFTTRDFNHGGVSGRSLFNPGDVSVDETGRLWVVDSVNERVLMWNPAPPTSFAEASLVVGQANLTSAGYSCIVSSTTVCLVASNVASKGNKLLIPDQCRVMIWNPGPTANGSAASIVLGQTSFNYCVKGNGAADLDLPNGVWTDGTRVAVADTNNNRVLIWTSFPTTNKQPADLVLGQADFGSSGCPNPPTGTTMCGPQSVHSDGVRLFVVDAYNHRVLVWRSFPTMNGQPADFTIGQPDLIANGNGHGASQFTYPFDVATIGDHLLVTDTGNNRVLVFSPIPTSSSASASFVLGQPNFETVSMGTTQATLTRPFGLAVSGNKLYVADYGNNRILRFDLKL
jgi:hypothetical protein